jgi:hypothetical protein
MAYTNTIFNTEGGLDTKLFIHCSGGLLNAQIPDTVSVHFSNIF